MMEIMDADEVSALLNEAIAALPNGEEDMEDIDFSALSQDILGVVTDNSAVSEECAASSTELSGFSDSLKESIGKFRTR